MCWFDVLLDYYFSGRWLVWLAMFVAIYMAGVYRVLG